MFETRVGSPLDFQLKRVSALKCLRALRFKRSGKSMRSPLLLLNTIFPASQHTKQQHKTHRLVKFVTKVRGLLSATKVAQLSCGWVRGLCAWCGVCSSINASVRLINRNQRLQSNDAKLQKQLQQSKTAKLRKHLLRNIRRLLSFLRCSETFDGDFRRLSSDLLSRIIRSIAVRLI